MASLNGSKSISRAERGSVPPRGVFQVSVATAAGTAVGRCGKEGAGCTLASGLQAWSGPSPKM